MGIEIENMLSKVEKNVIFAFNANIDGLKHISGEQIESLELPRPLEDLPEIMCKGEQKEIVINKKTKDWIVENIGIDYYLVGGQGGNAANTASLLGTECFLYTRYKNKEQMSLFKKPDKVKVAVGGKFTRGDKIEKQGENSLHIILEFKKGDKIFGNEIPCANRYIASYDPPMKGGIIDNEFQEAINSGINDINKAYVGGFHLFEKKSHILAYASEMRRWKEMNPDLKIHLEMGEFQKKEVFPLMKKEVFPLIDFMGLNEIELEQLTGSREFNASLLPGNFETILHTPKEHILHPKSKKAQEASRFASVAASYKAMHGKTPSPEQLKKHGSERKELYIESPKSTVGLGDTFGSAYFIVR